ncbi:hypothetical protein [Nocardia bovistercoris]|uniref:Uncharacterized protein n=1 Tax=Nocardia bovistercoris TaxID=2785916 RepID=A0A931IF41_9NOCA|nr:hypothetical protein [Nocardia bovistercoris]MBH0780354.1 hypothetical protein [Nocardia bovistercoris]
MSTPFGTPNTPQRPQSDHWIALLVALDLAVVAGLLDSWSAAVSVFAAAVSLFAAYRESQL